MMQTATQRSQTAQVAQKRMEAVRRFEAWKKRNAAQLQGWNPLEVLRIWRDKRWSSSTHQ